MAPPAINGLNGNKATNGTPSSWQARHDLHTNAPHFIGGSRLEKAPPSKVKDFVQSCDGHSAITSVS
jgi:acetyl-CoA carboxylase / biotin carboxylase 1